MEEYGGARQDTDDNIMWHMRFTCWISKATLARAHVHDYARKQKHTRRIHEHELINTHHSCAHTHTHRNIFYLLLLHVTHNYVTAPQPYVLRTLPALLVYHAL